MPVSGPLPAAMAASGDCTTNGLSFSAITGVTWKAFMVEVATRGRINKTAEVDVVVKAQPAAASSVNSVIGVTGIWVEDATAS